MVPAALKAPPSVLETSGFANEVAKVYRKNWAGHEKAATWRDMKTRWFDEFGPDVRTLVTKSKGEVGR